MFPPWFLSAIVYGGLALVAAGALCLVYLLTVDIRGRRLW